MAASKAKTFPSHQKKLLHKLPKVTARQYTWLHNFLNSGKDNTKGLQNFKSVDMQ
jgi:hypothetical protein